LKGDVTNPAWTDTTCCRARSITVSDVPRLDDEAAVDRAGAEDMVTRLVAGLETQLGIAIPVAFTIPYDAPPASPEPSDNIILWGLEVSGVDFHARFEVPVFRTAESSPEVTESSAASDEAEPAPVLSSPGSPVLPGSRIVAALLPDGGVELRFPAARNPGMATALLGVTVFWNGMVTIAGQEGGFLAIPLVGIKDKGEAERLLRLLREAFEAS
jgi:hypothetical protein